VFKNNRSKLIEANITFSKPYECREFAGSEVLISNSQEARLNTKQLMEKLRPLWENSSDEEISKIAEGEIKLQLFDNKGKLVPNFGLEVNKEELEKILHARIEKGIRNFFDAIKLNFSRNDIINVDSINIFLAGNSSKSPIVREIFDEYIKNHTEEILEKTDCEYKKEFFKIFPPLGTEESERIQQERGVQTDYDDAAKPTGKTGVAYGLIEGRKGSKIKVVSEIKIDDEAKFKYYIGYDRRKKFRVLINRDTPYNEWNYFIDASERDFEIYYSPLPEATTNQLPIKEVKKKLCSIAETDDNASVYIRLVGTAEIEYAVASEDGIKNGDFITEPVRIELA
jgi:hypothetical protein